MTTQGKGGRPATGSVEYVPPKRGEKQGHYKVRVTCADGSRPWVHLDAGPKSPKAEQRAREAAAHYTEQFRDRGIVGVRQRRTVAAKAPTASELTRDYVARWFDDRERRGLTSIKTDRGRMGLHVLPVIGDTPIAEVNTEQLRAVVELLDDKAGRGDFSWRTAVKVWGLVTKLFSDACEAKVAALRVRSDNPCAGVRGPDRREKKAKQWLYPNEATALLACEGSPDRPGVPLRWRRLYALAAYLYLRPGELAALEWADVNLEQRYVHVHQALDLRTGSVKATKTGITRKVPIPPALLPLVHAMHEAGKRRGRVVEHTHGNKTADHGLPPLEDLAATLRAHLKRAGVDRADLHEDRSTTKRITFYDLRATGITWEVLAGTEHVRIMQRAGHTNFATTQGYIREAEAVGLAVGVPFPPLPSSLLSGDVSSRFSSEVSSEESQPREIMASPTGFEGEAQSTIQHQNGSIRDHGDSPTPTHSDAKCADAGSPGRNSDDLGDPIERALALGVEAAAAAVARGEPGALEALTALSAELKARREARASVVSLDAARAKRGRS